MAFKQQSAEQAKTPGLEPGDGVQAKDVRYDSIPQEHDGQAQQEAQQDDEGQASDDSG